MSYTGYTIETIEDAVINTLKTDTTLSRYVRVFDLLPWDRVDELGKLVKQYPALLVAYSGGVDNRPVTNAVYHAGQFIILCCTKNLRSSSAAARSEDGREGVYDLLHDVFLCLQDSALGLSDPAIFNCQSSRVQALAASPGMAIFSREFEIEWSLIQG